MKVTVVYKLGPDVVSTAMFERAKEILGVGYPEYMPLAEAFLEVAKDYYRRGAFDMAHRLDGLKCSAEDQGGWPCCSRPSEFFVVDEQQQDEDQKIRHYCNIHRLKNRFYPAESMAPIYPKEASCR